MLVKRSYLELSVLFSTYFLTSRASPWTLLLEGPQLCSRPEGDAIVDQPYLWVVRTSYRVDECNSNLAFNSVGISLKKVIGIIFKLFFSTNGLRDRWPLKSSIAWRNEYCFAWTKLTDLNFKWKLLHFQQPTSTYCPSSSLLFMPSLFRFNTLKGRSRACLHVGLEYLPWGVLILIIGTNTTVSFHCIMVSD